MFKALLIEKNDDRYQTHLTELDDSQLPEGDVTVRVECSTLNYKAVSYTHLTLPTIYSV